MFNNTLNMLRN